MNGWMFTQFLDHMFQTNAMPKVLSSLQVEPMTARDLGRANRLTEGLVKFTIGRLRRAGHTIENRDSWCGKNPRKGTYHFVEAA